MEENKTIEQAVEVKKRKKRKSIDQDNFLIVLDTEGNIVYRFESIDEALLTLQVYSRKDIIYLCKKGEKREYKEKSKYAPFNGFTFTLAPKPKAKEEEVAATAE